MSAAAKFEILAMLFLSTIPQGRSIEQAFCAGTGYSNLSEMGYGLVSMGASSLYIHPLNTMWGANVMARPMMTRGDRPTVRIHSVSETLPNGTLLQLRGWLYFEIEKPENQYFNALAVWAYSGEKRTSGEFIYLPNNNCGLWPDLKNYVPCSTVSIDMPVTSNMFIYTDDGSRKERVFKLLWRLSSSYCNKPHGIYFFTSHFIWPTFRMAFNSMKWNEAFIPFNIREGQRDSNGNPTELGPVLIRTQFFETKFYGSAAPIFNSSALSCTLSKSEIEQTKPPWVRDVIPSFDDWGPLAEVHAEWTFERWDYQTGTENSVNAYFGSTCKAQPSGLHVFGGRCNAVATITEYTYADETKTPECIVRDFSWKPNELAQLELTGNFRAKLENRKTDVETGCDPDCILHFTQVPTEMEIISVAKTAEARLASLPDPLGGTSNNYLDKAYSCADRQNNTNTNFFGLCALTEAGHAIYGVRQWHGFALLFCSVIFIPIMCFIARYFKGPIPVVPSTKEAHLPLKPWYIVHVFLIIPMGCLFGSAMKAVERQTLALGHSKTLFARAHSFFGFVFFAVFVLQILSGFLRPLNIRLRRIAVFLHWLVGTILNYGGVVLCMLTYGIPSSPTSHVSILRTDEFYKIYNHAVPMTLLLWFVMEGLFHTFLTIYAVRFDKLRNINRIYFPIAIPNIVDNRCLIFDDDYKKKAKFMKRALIGYVFNCAGIYAACCVAIYAGKHDEQAMGLGPMTCTHDENNQYITGFDSNHSVELRQFYIDNHCEYFLHA